MCHHGLWESNSIWGMQAADLVFLARCEWHLQIDTDWLTDCASGRLPKGVNQSVGVCDCICLSMRLCADKSTDVCQIDKVFCSIKAVGYLSLRVCHSSWFYHILFAYFVWNIMLVPQIQIMWETSSMTLMYPSRTDHLIYQYKEYVMAIWEICMSIMNVVLRLAETCVILDLPVLLLAQQTIKTF